MIKILFFFGLTIFCTDSFANIFKDCLIKLIFHQKYTRIIHVEDEEFSIKSILPRERKDEIAKKRKRLKELKKTHGLGVMLKSNKYLSYIEVEGMQKLGVLLNKLQWDNQTFLFLHENNVFRIKVKLKDKLYDIFCVNKRKKCTYYYTVSRNGEQLDEGVSSSSGVQSLMEDLIYIPFNGTRKLPIRFSGNIPIVTMPESYYNNSVVHPFLNKIDDLFNYYPGIEIFLTKQITFNGVKETINSKRIIRLAKHKYRTIVRGGSSVDNDVLELMGRQIDTGKYSLKVKIKYKNGLRLLSLSRDDMLVILKNERTKEILDDIKVDGIFIQDIGTVTEKNDNFYFQRIYDSNPNNLKKFEDESKLLLPQSNAIGIPADFID